jgi:hypothetical protein
LCARVRIWLRSEVFDYTFKGIDDIFEIVAFEKLEIN